MIVFVNKWLHLLSMAGVIGWVAYAWFALGPALADREGEDVSKALWRRFGIGVAALWAVALLTGFYNLMVVAPSVTGTYHGFLGGKIALAILAFLVTVAIAHPIPGFDAIRRFRRPGLGVVLALAVIIIGISASLNISRVNGTGLKPKTQPAAAPPATPAEPGTDVPTAPPGLP